MVWRNNIKFNRGPFPFPGSFCTEKYNNLLQAEREKRDIMEKLEQERQSGVQAVKKIDKYKRDFEKMQQESAGIAR